jgi:steroid delta-isomerase-like uncharacterized protein
MEDTPSVATVRAAAAAFNRGDVDGYLGSFGSACSRWIVGFDTAMGPQDLRENVVQLLLSFDDLELSAEAMFGQDGAVCARWRLRGTHVGSFLGVAASGRKIDVRTCEVYEFEDGLVREVWTYGDPMELLRQIDDQDLEDAVR